MHKFTSKHFTSYGVSFKHQTLFSWDFEINYLNSPFFSSHLLKLQDNQIKHHSLIANVCFPVLWGTQQTYSFQQTNSDGALSESSLKCNEGKARKKIFKKKKNLTCHISALQLLKLSILLTYTDQVAKTGLTNRSRHLNPAEA